MEDSKSIFEKLQTDEAVPEYLKGALISEIDTIRDTMELVTLFTETLFASVIALTNSEDTHQEQ
jgi:hypothetical protein